MCISEERRQYIVKRFENDGGWEDAIVDFLKYKYFQIEVYRNLCQFDLETGSCHKARKIKAELEFGSTGEGGSSEKDPQWHLVQISAAIGSKKQGK